MSVCTRVRNVELGRRDVSSSSEGRVGGSGWEMRDEPSNANGGAWGLERRIDADLWGRWGFRMDTKLLEIYDQVG